MSARLYQVFMPRLQVGDGYTLVYQTPNATVIFRVPTSDDARSLRKFLNENVEIEVRCAEPTEE
jgi:hypothetical protein